MLSIRTSISQSRPWRLKAKTLGLSVKGDGRLVGQSLPGILLFDLQSSSWVDDTATTNSTLFDSSGFALSSTSSKGNHKTNYTM